MSTDKIAAKVDDLQDGQMKEILIEGRSFLLVRINGEYHAVGAYCNHYGASLADGVMCNHHVRCPWHHSVFDIGSGDLMEPPALNGLIRLEVRIEGEDVIVSLPDDMPDYRVMDMAKHNPQADSRKFVILGTGAAGNCAAETLRQKGFEGEIIMVTQEGSLPYDRPPLSKGYLKSQKEPQEPILRSENFYKENDIEIRRGSYVSKVDSLNHKIIFDGGNSLAYHKILLASGSIPKKLNVPGAEMENIFTLRSLSDCNRIRQSLKKSTSAVVVGSSFIGMEAAAAIREYKIPVTVVSPDSIPFEKVFGKEIGLMFQRLHEEHETNFQLGTEVERFTGNGKVEGVVLKNGQHLKADIVLVGIGVQPSTDYLTDIRANPNGSVTVDEQFQTANDVYAAGDIAQFSDWRSNELIRIEHWRLAEQHGRVAALNMLGIRTSFKTTPFFWTSQYNLIVQYAGFARNWDDIIFYGNPSNREFIAFYIIDERVLAVSGCDRDRQICAAAELMQAELMPSTPELREKEVDLVEILRGIKVHAS